MEKPKKRIILCILSFSVLLMFTNSIADNHPDLEEFGFQGEYCVFTTGGLMGVLNSDGTVIIPAQYIGIEPIIDKYCVVRNSTHYGLWDVERSIELLPCKHDSIRICSTMLIVDAKIFDPQNCSFIDLNRDYYVHYYSERSGLFVVYSPYEPWYGVVNLNGQLVFERFEELAGPGGLYLSSDGVISYIDIENHFRFYDTETLQSIGDSFSLNCLFFNNGFAAVSKEKKGGMYLINRCGERVSPLFDKIAYNPVGTTAVSINGWFAYNEGNGWSLGRISNENPDVLDFSIHIDSDTCPEYLGCELFAWYDDGVLTVYSVENGSIVTLYSDTIINPFINDAAIVETDQGYGIVFADLTITSCEYDNITNYIDEYALVCIDGVWHPINRQGIVNVKIGFPGTSCFVDNGFFRLIDNEGQIVFIDPDSHIVSRWYDSRWYDGVKK